MSQITDKAPGYEGHWVVLEGTEKIGGQAEKVERTKLLRNPDGEMATKIAAAKIARLI